MARAPAVVSTSELQRISIFDVARKLPFGEHVVRVREAARVIFYDIYSGERKGFERDALSVAVAQEVEYMLGVIPDTTLAEELWMMICDGLKHGGPKVTVEGALRLVGTMETEVREYHRAVRERIS